MNEITWTPSVRVPDPRVRELDPRFAHYRIAHAKVEFIALGRTNRLMHLSKSKALGGISTPGSDGGTRITPRTRIVTLPTLFENRRATQLVRN